MSDPKRWIVCAGRRPLAAPCFCEGIETGMGLNLACVARCTHAYDPAFGIVRTRSFQVGSGSGFDDDRAVIFTVQIPSPDIDGGM